MKKCRPISRDFNVLPEYRGQAKRTWYLRVQPAEISFAGLKSRCTAIFPRTTISSALAPTLTHHEALDAIGPSRGIVAINDDGAQARIPRGGLETHRHSIQELTHYQFFFDSNHS